MSLNEEKDVEKQLADQGTIVDDTPENLNEKVQQDSEEESPELDPNIGQTDVKLEPIDIHTAD